MAGIQVRTFESYAIASNETQDLIESFHDVFQLFLPVSQEIWPPENLAPP